MALTKFTFPGSQGHDLSARLDKPEGNIKAYALFAHCFTCGKDIFAASRIAKALNNHGIAVLRFDFTGLGMSDGEFENTNFSSNVEDLLKAADHMREELEAPGLLIGHSLGGTAVLKAAGQIDEVKGVVTIGAPFDAAHVSHHFEDQISQISDKGEAEVQLAGRPFKIQKQFVEDIQSQSMEEDIGDLKRALLVMHAPFDDKVGIDNASKIFVTAKHPKSFISLDDADHLISEHKDADYAASVIAAWASRYLDIEMKSQIKVDEEDSTADVIVTTTGKGNYQNTIKMGKHQITADEPKSYGGDDTGPDPYSLLMASLGACTSITLQMYAQKKKLNLEGVEVHLDHNKIHASDCESCDKENDNKNDKVDKFTRTLVIKGESLSKEERKRLLEIADKCPVHKTLKSQIQIETNEKD